MEDQSKSEEPIPAEDVEALYEKWKEINKTSLKIISDQLGVADALMKDAEKTLLSARRAMIIKNVYIAILVVTNILTVWMLVSR